ncbi:MAG: FtsL-like putative cell division protein [Candidatus Limimorpha sp.]
MKKNPKQKDSFFQEYLGGEVFSKKSVISQLPFLCYIVFLLGLYITNTYLAEDVNREIITLSASIEEKRIEYVYNKSRIIRLTKQTELVKRLEDRGIKESTEPLRRIVVQEDKNKKQ